MVFSLEYVHVYVWVCISLPLPQLVEVTPPNYVELLQNCAPLDGNATALYIHLKIYGIALTHSLSRSWCSRSKTSLLALANCLLFVGSWSLEQRQLWLLFMCYLEKKGGRYCIKLLKVLRKHVTNNKIQRFQTQWLDEVSQWILSTCMLQMFNNINIFDEGVNMIW